MRVTPAVLRLALCLSSLTPIVSAWPGWLPAKDALYVRQNDDDSERTVICMFWFKSRLSCSIFEVYLMDM